MLLDRSPKTIKQIQKRADSTTYIEQGYLVCDKGMSVRIRHSQKEKKSTWMMTTKVDVPERVIEIEAKIEEERDAHDLWARCHPKLKKVRHHIKDKKSRVWEVDIFLKEEVENIEEQCYHEPRAIFPDSEGISTYCILAEVELPEKAPRPTDVPDFISEHLLYAVPLRDGRFSNKKLWNVEYVNGLYQLYHILSEGV